MKKQDGRNRHGQHRQPHCRRQDHEVHQPQGKPQTLAQPVQVTVLHLQGYGMVRVFRIDAPNGVAEYWATNDLGMDAGLRQYYGELSFGIENYHRELKQNCGVEKCQVRAAKAQRNHIGLALRAFLRLEWHFFTTGISGFETKLSLVREAVGAIWPGLGSPFQNRQLRNS